MRFGHGSTSFALALLVAVGLWGGSELLYGRIEWRMAPLIDAIARYENDHHRLPEKREDLVPAYLRELPSCPYDTMTDVALGMTDGPWQGGWKITCGTFFWQRYSYDREKRSWYVWD